MPTFTGMLMVFDSENGMPLGVMDAFYITCMRTGAAGAIGAQALGEIDPKLFAGARIYADDVDQCMRVGEMEIPVKKGIISRDDICGEIGQVLAGTAEGRTSADDITIFDATGLALLDLVTAKAAIALAEEKHLGTTVEI